VKSSDLRNAALVAMQGLRKSFGNAGSLRFQRKQSRLARTLFKEPWAKTHHRWLFVEVRLAENATSSEAWQSHDSI